MATKCPKPTSKATKGGTTLDTALESDSTSAVFSDNSEAQIVYESTEACGNVVSLRDIPFKPPPKQQRTSMPIGRPMFSTTFLLSNFHNKNNKPLRKEYIRCQIIRATKKCVRCMLTGRKTTTGLFRLLPRDIEMMLIWQQMERLVVCNREFFTSLSDTREVTKGVNGQNEGKVGPFRTYSDTYCRSFYSNVLTRQFHSLCMLVIYGEGRANPKQLCEKLEAYCCAGGHSARCEVKWDQLRDYAKYGMISELGLRPYNVQQEPCTANQEETAFDDPDIFLALGKTV